MARRSVTIVAYDGTREGISWYDGATEAAVLRCALVALRLPPGGGAAAAAAHLLWESGDRVDFGKPITDGATLHLDAAHAAPSSHHGGGGGGLYSADSGLVGGGGSGGGGGGGVSSGFGAAVGGSAVAQRRVGSSNTPAGGGGGSITDPADRGRRVPRPDPSESSLAKRRALLTIRRFFGARSGGGGTGGTGGFLSSFLESTVPGSDSDGEQERRPLLEPSRVSSSTSLPSPLSSSSGGGGGGRGRRDVGGDGSGDGGRDSPDQQRDAILKLKRINAHLANERTLLAWVRCVGKMFSAGVLSLALAAQEQNRTFAVCFACMGMVYVAMGPYVVFVGATRFHQAADVMQGTVHDAYSYFSGGHLRSLSFLMMAVAVITVGLMVIQLLATFEFAG